MVARSDSAFFAHISYGFVLGAGEGEAPGFPLDVNQAGMLAEFWDAVRGVDGDSLDISMIVDGIHSQPISAGWNRNIGAWRARVGALMSTPRALGEEECRAWLWRLVSEALAGLGRRLEREIPSLWDFAPESVAAVQDFPLCHVQLAPGWGGAATGKRVAAAVLRWRRLAGPVVSRLDEAVRSGEVSVRARQPELYVCPVLAGRAVPTDLRDVSSVAVVQVSPGLMDLSEEEAFASVCADLQGWWREVCTGPAAPLDSSILVREYTWVSGLQAEIRMLPVRLRVRESVEGVFGRLEEETAEGVRAGVEERLVMPAWVYARQECGDWDVRRDGTAEVGYLDPFYLGGGARRLVLAPSGAGGAPGRPSGGGSGGEVDGFGMDEERDDEMADDMDDEDFPDDEDSPGDGDEESLGWADPAFGAHFTDPLYEDPAGEFAPFGTDEGADLLAEWSERVEELTDGMTVADLLAESGFEGVVEDLGLPDSGAAVPEPGGPIDAATIVVGAAFTLLRLSGRIDPEGREVALRGLAVLAAAYGQVPELERQRVDLETWHNPQDRA